MALATHLQLENQVLALLCRIIGVLCRKDNVGLDNLSSLSIGRGDHGRLQDAGMLLERAFYLCTNPANRCLVSPVLLVEKKD